MSEKWKRKMNKLAHTLVSLVSPSFPEDPSGEAPISFTNSTSVLINSSQVCHSGTNQ